MGMKFLNKKGWHTGSLRNIENVWKAEQKHDAEQKKLEELRKQIKEEREKSEFRLLQEQAGLVPRQERLEFLYESGLAVGKGSTTNSDAVFKALEQPPQVPPSSSSSAAPSTIQQQPLFPGAEKAAPAQSANDAWRKLHSDPLLLIRQREQQSMARLKNNPVQMAIIRNSVEASKSKVKTSESKEHREKKRHKKKSKHHRYSSPDEDKEERTDVRVGKSGTKNDGLSDKTDHVSRREKERNKRRKDSSSSEEDEERSTYSRVAGRKSSKGGDRSDRTAHDPEREERNGERGNRHHQYRDSSPVEREERRKYTRDDVKSSRSDERPNKIDYITDKENPKYKEKELKKGKEGDSRLPPSSTLNGSSSDVYNQRRSPRHSSSKLTAEERAARLKEMQMDAEVHEENRWKRIKKADEIDTLQEARTSNNTTSGDSKNFLDAAKRSVYGAEKGGSASIEESLRRRTHYRQSNSEVGQGNAFRR